MNRGSEWNKWDLHVHTPSSIVQHYGGDRDDVWEKYIQDLEKLPLEFKVLGINDYLFLDGYARLKKEKEQNNRLQNIELLLPVIEFRIEKFAGVDFGKLQRINLHVIFSNDVTVETIQSQFLNTLEQSYQIEQTGGSWSRAITRDSVSELGEKVINSVPEEQKFKYDNPLNEGFNNLNVKEDMIFKSLEKDCFKGKFLIAIGKTEWDQLKWTDASILTKKDIINKADIVFTSSQDINSFINAKTKLTNQGVKDLLLDCSDAHRFSDDSNKDRIGKCFTWIKAMPTFEGLKQIIYEPSRVHIGENNPQCALHKLEEVQLNFDENTKWDNDKFCFSDFQGSIKFSPYLSCIIGGRGSGKSTLLNLIAEKIGKGNKNFFSKLSEKNISSKVSFVPDIIENIEYLAQNEVEEFAKDSTKFTQAIFERLDKKADNNLTLIQNKITSGLKIFDEQINRLMLHFEKTKILASKINELSKTEYLLKTFLNSEFNKNSMIMNTFIEEKSTRLKWKTNYENSLQELLNVIQKIELQVEEKDESPESWTNDNNYKKEQRNLTNELTKILRKYQDIDFPLDIKRLTDIEIEISNCKNTIDNYLQERGYSLENLNDLKNAISNKSTIESEIINLKEEINLIEKDISSFNTTNIDETINQFKFEINNEISKINQLFLNIAIQHSQNVKEIKVEFTINENIFNGVFEEFMSKLAPTQKNNATLKDYLGQISLSDTLLCDNVELFRQKIVYRKTQAYENLIEIFSIELNFIIYKLLIQKHLKDIEKYKILKVLYDNKELENSSFGQRCTAAIVILLSLGNNPIIIDEPEAHLDSSLIANYLVELIKQQKQQRQIIFATHNANFVLNADAELIIKLENIDGLSSSVFFAIEDLNHREDLLKLEGGKEAFKKREQKYNI